MSFQQEGLIGLMGDYAEIHVITAGRLPLTTFIVTLFQLSLQPREIILLYFLPSWLFPVPTPPVIHVGANVTPTSNNSGHIAGTQM